MVDIHPFFIYVDNSVEAAIYRGEGLYELHLNEEIMSFPYKPGEAAEVLLRVRKIIQEKIKCQNDHES